MTLTSKSLAAIIVALMFGAIFFSSALGWWQTTSTKEAAVYTEGEFAGQANPADIRGSYTLGDVEKNFGVPATLVAKAFGVQSDAPATYPVKGLEEMYAESPQEVGTASVRLFVAFYLGLPFDLSTDIYLPEAAAAILHTRKLSEEQTAYLDAHRVPNPGEAAPAAQPAVPEQPASSSEPTPAATEHVPVVEEGILKGKTTFAELLKWGLTAESIEQVLGMPMPVAPGMTVKDFCSQNGLSFETIKPALQAELDKLK